MENIKSLIDGYVAGFGTGISKEKIVSNIHRFLCSKSIGNCIINDKYIEVDDCVFEFIRKRSEGKWIVKVI